MASSTPRLSSKLASGHCLLERGIAFILILGGNKNGQEKDIKKAQKTAEKIHGY
jgi:hypothetical protein